mmetsp:Transcript_24326/g.78597  ORF Transcript_24326/g.78597 Transcript_24326/m.78597 type:complete len:220 (+) Transcript_24326:34-693(+)
MMMITSSPKTFRMVLSTLLVASRGCRAFVLPGVVARVERRLSSESDYPFSAMDIRVGKFVSAREHPDSEKLFVEDIDLGEDEPRQIVSGLRAYYTLEDLEDQRCLVVANLPKAKLAGVDSFGMVLCGSEGDDKAKVEFLEPPATADLGDRVLLAPDDEEEEAAAAGPPLTSNQVKKKKVWTKIQPKLAIVDGVATFDGTPLNVNGEPCSPKTIQNGPIS